MGNDRMRPQANSNTALGPRAVPGSQRLRTQKGDHSPYYLPEPAKELRARDGSRSATAGRSHGLVGALGCGGRSLLSLTLLTLGACLAAVFAANARAAQTSKLPNIVIIFTDDQGYADVGVFGAKGFHTPNLDRLAAEGAFSATSMWPSRFARPRARGC